MSGSDHGSDETWFPDGGAAPEAIRTGPRYRDAVEVGTGSMGRVLGVLDDRLGRRVAYKELRKELISPTARARFLREARITAQLQHPGIAPVYDLGQDDDGTPWYTMRFVEGGTLRDALKQAPDLAGRLALLPRFVDACQAVAYAHDCGIVHRDLKPENVVVGDFGQTLVVDWGLAKNAGDEELLDPSLPAGSAATDGTGTRAGTVLGTPNWMSPEQARGEVHSLDARTDVWSLGVVLYQILAGTRPFQGRTAEETLEKVRVAPLPRIAEPGVPTELVAICARCLSRAPDQRYPNAAALAADVEAFLSGGWVRAYDYSAGERLARLLVRYRLLVGTIAASAVVLAAVGAVSFRQVRDQRDRAREAEATGRQHLAEAFAGKAITALETGDLIQAELFAAGALALHERPDARGVLARTRATWRPRIVRSFGPEEGCRAVHAWPDGTRAACAGASGVSAWSVEGESAMLWSVPGDARSVAVSPDGTRVAALDRSHFRVLDARDGRALATVEAPRRSANPRPAWRADGRRVAFARGGTIHLHDGDGTALNTVHARGSVTDLAWLDDQLVATDLSGHVVVLDADHRALAQVSGPHVTNGLYSLATSPGVVAVGTGSEGVLLLEPHTLEPIGRVSGHAGPVLSLVFSPDGNWLVSTGEDQTVRMVATHSREQAFALPLPSGTTGSLHFHAPDRLLIASPGARPRSWEVPLERPASTLGDHIAGLSAVAWHPDGARLATATGPGHVDLYDRREHDPHVLRIEAATKVIRDVVFGDPLTLLSSSSTPKVEAWSLDGERVAVLQDGPIVLNLDRDPVRGHVYGPDASGMLHRWEQWGPPTESFTGDAEQSLWEVAVSDDGSTLAWADGEDEVKVVSLPDRRPLLTQRFPTSPRAIALAPDGKRLAWATGNEQLEVRTVPEGRALLQFRGPENAIDDLEFSPDGGLLVASSWDQSAWVFDSHTGAVVAILQDHDHRVVDAEFAPDGRLLATASWDGTVRIWDMHALRVDPLEVLAELEAGQGVRMEGARLVSLDPGAPP